MLHHCLGRSRLSVECMDSVILLRTEEHRTKECIVCHIVHIRSTYTCMYVCMYIIVYVSKSGTSMSGRYVGQGGCMRHTVFLFIYVYSGIGCVTSSRLCCWEHSCSCSFILLCRAAVPITGTGMNLKKKTKTKNGQTRKKK